MHAFLSGMKMKLPRYEKVSSQLHGLCLLSIKAFISRLLINFFSFLMQSANNGRGDRADPSTWPEVEGPLTVRCIFNL